MVLHIVNERHKLWFCTLFINITNCGLLHYSWMSQIEVLYIYHKHHKLWSCTLLMTVKLTCTQCYEYQVIFIVRKYHYGVLINIVNSNHKLWSFTLFMKITKIVVLYIANERHKLWSWILVMNVKLWSLYIVHDCLIDLYIMFMNAKLCLL